MNNKQECCEHWGENSNNQFVCLCSGNCHQKEETRGANYVDCTCLASLPSKITHSIECPLFISTPSTPGKPIESWEEELDKKYLHGGLEYNGELVQTEIKSFISKKIEEAREEVRLRAYNLANENAEFGFKAGRASVLAELGEEIMEIIEAEKATWKVGGAVEKSLNKILSDTQAIIKSKQQTK